MVHRAVIRRSARGGACGGGGLRLSAPRTRSRARVGARLGAESWSAGRHPVEMAWGWASARLGGAASGAGRQGSGWSPAPGVDIACIGWKLHLARPLPPRDRAAFHPFFAVTCQQSPLLACAWSPRWPHPHADQCMWLGGVTLPRSGQGGREDIREARETCLHMAATDGERGRVHWDAVQPRWS